MRKDDELKREVSLLVDEIVLQQGSELGRKGGRIVEGGNMWELGIKGTGRLEEERLTTGVGDTNELEGEVIKASEGKEGGIERVEETNGEGLERAGEEEEKEWLGKGREEEWGLALPSPYVLFVQSLDPWSSAPQVKHL